MEYRFLEISYCIKYRQLENRVTGKKAVTKGSIQQLKKALTTIHLQIQKPDFHFFMTPTKMNLECV